MGKIKNIILSGILAGTLVSACAAEKITRIPEPDEYITDVTTTFDGDLDKMIEEAFNKNDIYFQMSENNQLTTMTIKLGKRKFFMQDGCYDNLVTFGDCDYDGVQDHCGEINNGKKVFEYLTKISAHAACGALAEKVKNKTIKLHIKRFKNLVDKIYQKDIVRTNIFGNLQLTIGDESVAYTVFHSEDPNIYDRITYSKANDAEYKLQISGLSKGIKKLGKVLMNIADTAEKYPPDLETEYPDF